MTERPQTPRFDYLSQSESGLSYVREKRGGITRVLTESELADFNDPAPCPSCGEQFGCDHFNCAGEPLLDDERTAHAVPEQWQRFARAEGVSEQDIERLRQLEEHDGVYRIKQGAATDMRMQEILLLLNGDEE
jgi:hypothetical protein